MKTAEEWNKWRDFFQSQGYDVYDDDPQLWMEEHISDEHKFRDIIDLIEEFNSQRPTLSQGEVTQLLKSHNAFRNDCQRTNREIGDAENILATAICQLAPKQVSERGFNFGKPMTGREAELLNEHIKAESVTEPTLPGRDGLTPGKRVGEKCTNYESDDTTAMNCKWCGEPKRAHDCQSLTPESKQPSQSKYFDKALSETSEESKERVKTLMDAQERYNRAIEHWDDSLKDDDLGDVRGAIHIASGWPPAPEQEEGEK